MVARGEAIKRKRPSPKQAALIGLFADTWLKMQAWASNAGDEELLKAEKACLAHSTSNCSWNEYKAAQEFLQLVQCELRDRGLKEKA